LVKKVILRHLVLLTSVAGEPHYYEARENEFLMPRNYHVLVGSQNPLVGVRTFGTGFLVFKDDRCYVVTCRHVIKEAANNNLFVITKPRKTKNLIGSDSVLTIGTPRFHPQDDETGTFDIAVAQILDVNLQLLKIKGIAPFDMAKYQIVSSYREGEKFLAEGYPVMYTEAALAENSNEPLLPKRIMGTFHAIPLQELLKEDQHGFNAPLREFFFAETNDQNSTGEGMSGSIIRAINSDQIAGVMLGKCDLSLSANGMASKKINGFIFTSAERIFETLAAYTARREGG